MGSSDGGFSLVVEGGLRLQTSVVMAHKLVASITCGIFLDQIQAVSPALQDLISKTLDHRILLNTGNSTLCLNGD